MGFPDLTPQPDAAIVISDALPDAQDAVTAADAAKKKRRRAVVRPAKGAIAKLLKTSEAAEKPAAEPAEPATQKAAAEAVQAAEQAAQRQALQVRRASTSSASWVDRHVGCIASRRHDSILHDQLGHMCTMQGAAAESGTSFAQYAASLLSLPAATESATPSAGSIKQVARRLSGILQDAMLGRHGDIALSVNEGEGRSQI